jgi:hypothetical protein
LDFRNGLLIRIDHKDNLDRVLAGRVLYPDFSNSKDRSALSFSAASTSASSLGDKIVGLPTPKVATAFASSYQNPMLAPGGTGLTPLAAKAKVPEVDVSEHCCCSWW